MNTRIRLRPIASLLALSALAGCSLAPPYQRPDLATATTPAAWKTVEGWRPANPSDGALRPDWWTAFGDATLDDLIARANAHNQTLAQAAAVWRQATAATREARASLFPTVSATGSVTHTESGATVRNATDSGTGATVINGQSSDSYRVNVQASWQPDLFGSVTNTVRNARYTAEARLADVANARLAIQGELVTDYLSLRATDATIASLTATVEAYQRSLDIASNQYKAGIVAKTDMFQAESQLASAQSDLEGQTRTRTQYEDAIAVLIGENPAGFRIASTGTAWTPVVPDAPVVLPSALVERRPDIASAERAVAAANATIGVNRAAFFPTVSLTGSGGFSGNALSSLFDAGASLWSLGASVAETLLDFGARGARVAQARAAYDAAVANYRQVTLTAFQGVQDNLVAQEVLARQEQYLRTASVAADQSERTLRNQYRAGIVVYTNVVTAQATALNARRALIQAQLDRQTAYVALVQALGGGWTSADLGDAGRRTAQAQGQ